MTGLLTTVDNPYSPFEQYKEWLQFDLNKGYNTNGLLDRFCFSSMELSEEDEALAIETAMQEIITLNPLGIHVVRDKDFYKVEYKDT